MEDLIKESMGQKSFAAVSATDSTDKHGNRIAKNLRVVHGVCVILTENPGQSASMRGH